MKSLPSVLAALLTFLALPALSHEFWLDAQEFQVDLGGEIQATLKNGETFEGGDLAYNARRAVLFDMIDANGRRDVGARAGDAPAFAQNAQADGLLTLLYQSTHSTLTYTSWEKFQKFADHKAFGDVRAQHDARGLPSDRFKESYVRFAKSLIGVGSSAGSDAPRGLEVEIVALKNPYTEDLSAGLPVQVLYRDQPRIGAQVEVFERAPDGAVKVWTVQTGADGAALIEVSSGHAYLLDNVVLRVPSQALADEKGAVWETLWAALTFGVP